MGQTALDVVLSAREHSAGAVTVFHERKTRAEGRNYRVEVNVPGLVARVDSVEDGKRGAQAIAEALTAKFKAGQDANGTPIDTAAATLRRREFRRREWADKGETVRGYHASVVEAKAEARRTRRRAKMAGLAMPETREIAAGEGYRDLVLRFLLGAGWYDPVRGAGAPAGSEGAVAPEVRVRNQRGGTLFPPLPAGEQKGGVESGLFANNLTVRYMGGRTQSARWGIFFPAQRERYVQWAESHGYVLAEVPPEVDAILGQIVELRAAEIAGVNWRDLGRTATDILQRAGAVIHWAFA